MHSNADQTNATQETPQSGGRTVDAEYSAQPYSSPHEDASGVRDEYLRSSSRSRSQFGTEAPHGQAPLATSVTSLPTAHEPARTSISTFRSTESTYDSDARRQDQERNVPPVPAVNSTNFGASEREPMRHDARDYRTDQMTGNLAGQPAHQERRPDHLSPDTGDYQLPLLPPRSPKRMSATSLEHFAAPQTQAHNRDLTTLHERDRSSSRNNPATRPDARAEALSSNPVSQQQPAQSRSGVVPESSGQSNPSIEPQDYDRNLHPLLRAPADQSRNSLPQGRTAKRDDIRINTKEVPSNSVPSHASMTSPMSYRSGVESPIMAPPTPRNIDQLPPSIQKRYRKYSLPAAEAQRPTEMGMRHDQDSMSGALSREAPRSSHPGPVQAGRQYDGEAQPPMPRFDDNRNSQPMMSPQAMSPRGQDIEYGLPGVGPPEEIPSKRRSASPWRRFRARSRGARDDADMHHDSMDSGIPSEEPTTSTTTHKQDRRRSMSPWGRLRRRSRGASMDRNSMPPMADQEQPPVPPLPSTANRTDRAYGSPISPSDEAEQVRRQSGRSGSSRPTERGKAFAYGDVPVDEARSANRHASMPPTPVAREGVDGAQFSPSDEAARVRQSESHNRRSMQQNRSQPDSRRFDASPAMPHDDRISSAPIQSPREATQARQRDSYGPNSIQQTPASFGSQFPHSSPGMYSQRQQTPSSRDFPPLDTTGLGVQQVPNHTSSSYVMNHPGDGETDDDVANRPRRQSTNRETNPLAMMSNATPPSQQLADVPENRSNNQDQAAKDRPAAQKRKSWFSNMFSSSSPTSSNPSSQPGKLNKLTKRQSRTASRRPSPPKEALIDPGAPAEDWASQTEASIAEVGRRDTQRARPKSWAFDHRIKSPIQDVPPVPDFKTREDHLSYLQTNDIFPQRPRSTVYEDTSGNTMGQRYPSGQGPSNGSFGANRPLEGAHGTEDYGAYQPREEVPPVPRLPSTYKTAPREQGLRSAMKSRMPESSGYREPARVEARSASQPMQRQPPEGTIAQRRDPDAPVMSATLPAPFTSLDTSHQSRQPTHSHQRSMSTSPGRGNSDVEDEDSDERPPQKYVPWLSTLKNNSAYIAKGRPESRDKTDSDVEEPSPYAPVNTGGSPIIQGPYNPFQSSPYNSVNSQRSAPYQPQASDAPYSEFGMRNRGYSGKLDNQQRSAGGRNSPAIGAQPTATSSVYSTLRSTVTAPSNDFGTSNSRTSTEQPGSRIMSNDFGTSNSRTSTEQPATRITSSNYSSANNRDRSGSGTRQVSAGSGHAAPPSYTPMPIPQRRTPTPSGGTSAADSSARPRTSTSSQSYVANLPTLGPERTSTEQRYSTEQHYSTDRSQTASPPRNIHTSSTNDTFTSAPNSPQRQTIRPVNEPATSAPTNNTSTSRPTTSQRTSPLTSPPLSSSANRALALNSTNTSPPPSLSTRKPIGSAPTTRTQKGKSLPLLPGQASPRLSSSSGFDHQTRPTSQSQHQSQNQTQSQDFDPNEPLEPPPRLTDPAAGPSPSNSNNATNRSTRSSFETAGRSRAGSNASEGGYESTGSAYDSRPGTSGGDGKKKRFSRKRQEGNKSVSSFLSFGSRDSKTGEKRYKDPRVSSSRWNLNRGC